MTTALKHKIENADVREAELMIAACATDHQVWHPKALLEREAGSGERVAAADGTWPESLTCDALLQTGPDGELLVAAETDESTSDRTWRCEDEAEFQVIFGPRTNPEGGVGVRLRCLDCADSAVTACGLGQVQLLAL